MARERHDAAFMVGALVGGVVGGLYGLFTAPQAGARTRADLARRWDDLAEQGAQAIAAADGRVRDALGRDQAPPAPSGRTLGATPLVSASGPFIEAEGDPVLLLPDPLEPDPVAVVDVEVDVVVAAEPAAEADLLIGSGGVADAGAPGDAGDETPPPAIERSP